MPDNAHSYHVVMITNVVAPDKLGGLERYVRELSDHLVSSGAQVTVISKRTQPQQAEDESLPSGLRILRYKGPSKSNPFFALAYPILVTSRVQAAIRKAVQETEAGRRVVLHAHFPIPALALALTRQRYIYTCHAPVHKEIVPERQGSYLLPKATQHIAVNGVRKLERFVLRKAGTIVTLSDFVRHEVGALHSKAMTRVQRIPGGLDTTWFTPAEETPTRSPANLTVFTARRLVERTGVENLVKAMPEILIHLPELKLYIAGSGPRESAIRQLIATNHLENAVTLLGRIPEEALRDWYRRADIAVTPTKELEGFGLSTAEALACGTPALVTPVGANPEVVDGLSHLLVAADAGPSGIAEAVVRLGTSADLLQIRSRSRSHVHPRFGWSAVVESHLRMYAAESSMKQGDS